MSTPRPQLIALVLGIVLASGAAGAQPETPGAPCAPDLSADYARPQRVLRVDAAGGGDFTSIQSAVDATLAGRCRSRVEIRIAPGRYRERVSIPHEAPPLLLRGLGGAPEDVVLRSALRNQDSGADGLPLSAWQAATLYVASDDHIVSNLAIANTAVKIWGERGGSPAARVEGDRITFSNVAFVNWGSDTISSVWGRHYYHRCRIEARDKGADFVYGTAQAVFHGCRFRVERSNLYLVAHARTGTADLGSAEWARKVGRSAGPRERRDSGGFVFSGCRFETGPGTEAFLGRPWGKPGPGGAPVHGRIVVLDSWLGGGIRPEGWTVQGAAEREKTAFFGEFGNRGPGSATGGRHAWVRQLDAERAAAFRTERFLRDPAGQVDAWLKYVLELEAGVADESGPE